MPRETEYGTIFRQGVAGMTTALVSEKGQVTIPADVRRKLGIGPRSRVEIVVKDDEIVIRPRKSIRDLEGILHRYAEGKSSDWDAIREETMRRVAEQVANE